jgi:hypothetical protein
MIDGASFSPSAQAKLMATLNALILMAMSVCEPLLFAFVLRQTIVRTKARPTHRHWSSALNAFGV